MLLAGGPRTFDISNEDEDDNDTIEMQFSPHKVTSSRPVLGINTKAIDEDSMDFSPGVSFDSN